MVVPVASNRIPVLPPGQREVNESLGFWYRSFHEQLISHRQGCFEGFSEAAFFIQFPSIQHEIVFPILSSRDAPNIGWVEPISTGGIYEFDGLGPLLLEVEGASNENIDSVRFYRWDEPNLQHITIAEVSVNGSGKYQTFVDTAALNPGLNQVFAYAVNAEGMTSPHQWIWLLRLDGAVYKLYFPEVAKRP